MKIGIGVRPGSFSDGWIEYCQKHGVNYKAVDPYASDIVQQVGDCDGLMWHWRHDSYADQLFARQLTLALDASGKKVFPSVATAWHFDDKLGQKYLFEAVGCGAVPAVCFYERKAALRWLQTASFPLVFKLRGGAGSQNIRLVPDVPTAERLVERAFGKGFSPSPLIGAAKQKLWESRRDRSAFDLGKMLFYFGAAVVGASSKASRFRNRELGYIYFQEFVPGNSYDDRLVVIGDRCFGLRRFCRAGDFRASGSGLFEYDHKQFPDASIEMAFAVSRKIGAQCLAFDFVYDDAGCPRILEISYGFATGGVYEKCDGYFDLHLTWHDNDVAPEHFMIEDFIDALRMAEG
jgi:glutathione synthase/RimK-type ligase-like ATP-grasp enzyme